MNDTTVLEDAVSGILKDYYTTDILVAAKRLGWCPELWATLQETGMTLVSVPEASGGTGGSLRDAASVVRLAGKYCAPVPLADTALLGGWALARAGLPVPSHPLAFAVANAKQALAVSRERGGGWRFSGTLRKVPFARFAKTLVIVSGHEDECIVASLSPAQYGIVQGTNLAAEARDDVVLDNQLVSADQVKIAPPDLSVETAMERGALSRALMMCGALDGILEMSVRYTKQRVQFGRPLAKFQAIQQELAKLAGDAAIATACAMSAAASLGTAMQSFDVAVAKVRAGEAAQSGSMIAHQVHGAMGLTEEYPLHHSTLRIWSWRSEYGSEAQWSERLSATAIERGSRWLWDTITRY